MNKMLGHALILLVPVQELLLLQNQHFLTVKNLEMLIRQMQRMIYLRFIELNLEFESKPTKITYEIVKYYLNLSLLQMEGLEHF